MAACSAAKLVAESCRSCSSSIEICTVGKFYGQMVILIRSIEAWNFTKNTILKLANSIKTDFLFAALNLNTIVQKKIPKMQVLWMML